MKIKKGDTVKVITGSDKGATGEVLEVLGKLNKVVVQGVNVKTKHKKPTQGDPEGRIVEKEAPIDASNVAYFDSKAKTTTRIGYQVKDGEKIRVSKKTGAPVDKKKKK